MPYDGKYGRVATERKQIPDNEPVIVFRAQDRLVPGLLVLYRAVCESEGAGADHLDAIDRTRRRFEDWQAEHLAKTPDTLPGEYQ
jgi:hypothetical protein